MRWRPEFVKGIGKRHGQFVIIPDMAKIFDTQGARTAPSAASEERAQA
jgi:purine-binding chemotaxis protein CheW